ncbi:MAG: sulfite exporter TauE/SafE family protein, partial [Planctomycetales bacterium]|nr:sulfite exporter TauE/SafE family protein [Planctomycetales bacterium]
MSFSLAILFGSLVGFALGLTGGGGGIFAVPLLVYGMSIAPREAVGVSLASVGGTALLGVTPRLFRGEVEVRTGLMFAVAGMLGAPLGSWLSKLLPESLLLVLFAVLMLVIATRMWKASFPRPRILDAAQRDQADEKQATCQRNERGELRLNSRCAMLLAVIGVLTGVLSGMFGVGGGFVI